MDLKALKYVVAAASLKSISKAAAQLHVAQPALSRQIRLLEEELGVPLLLRHRRGVEPTKEGLDLVRSAEVLLRMAQQLRDDMGSRDTEPVGRIRLGFLPGPGDLIIGKVVADFLRQYPKVSFLLREALTAELTDALLAGKLDLAIMIHDVKHQDLHRKPLFAEDVWLAGMPSLWPFGKTKQLLPRQLHGVPLIHAAIVGNALAALTEAHGLEIRTVIEGDTRAAARAAVRGGVGFMLMPESSVAAEIANHELAGAPVKGMEVRRGLFWRADHPLSRATVEFIAKLEGAVSALLSVKPSPIKKIASAD